MIIQVLLLVLALILAVLMWMLFMPIHLQVDSVKGYAGLRLKSVLHLSIQWMNEEEILVRLWIVGFKKSFNLLDLPARKDKNPEKRSTKTGGHRRSLTNKQMFAMLKSFQVRVCYVTINTGDYVYNALLVPIFQLLNERAGNFSVSFHEGSSIQLYATNSLWKLGRAFIANR